MGGSPDPTSPDVLLFPEMILKLRVTFCHFLFFDIIIALATVAPPLSKASVVRFPNPLLGHSSQLVNLTKESEDPAMVTNQTGVGNKTEGEEWVSKEVTTVIIEVFLLFTNSVTLFGLLGIFVMIVDDKLNSGPVDIDSESDI